MDAHFMALIMQVNKSTPVQMYSFILIITPTVCSIVTGRSVLSLSSSPPSPPPPLPPPRGDPNFAAVLVCASDEFALTLRGFSPSGGSSGVLVVRTGGACTPSPDDAQVHHNTAVADSSVRQSPHTVCALILIEHTVC